MSCSGVLSTLLSSAWRGEGNCSHPRQFSPGFQPGCDSPSLAGSPGTQLIARVCTARLEPAQGESPQTCAGPLWRPQHHLFCSLCSRTCTNTGLCHPTPVPVQRHLLRHRRTEGVWLCSAFTSHSTPARASPGHPARGAGSGLTLKICHVLVPDLSCLGDLENAHPNALFNTHSTELEIIQSS